MAKNLIDLLWWQEGGSARTGRRGPRARWSTPQVVAKAIRLADAHGLAAVTIRGLAQQLQITPMSVYTHVNSRDDLLVLMADRVHTEAADAAADAPSVAGDWRMRVRAVAEVNLTLLRRHPWLLQIDDQRTTFGPGTIAKYDRELHAFDQTGLSDIDRDAALTFVLDFVRASADRMATTVAPGDFGPLWEDASGTLADRIGADYPLARRVGAAAGEQLGAPYDARAAWEFGLERVLSGLDSVVTA